MIIYCDAWQRLNSAVNAISCRIDCSVAEVQVDEAEYYCVQLRSIKADIADTEQESIQMYGEGFISRTELVSCLMTVQTWVELIDKYLADIEKLQKPSIKDDLQKILERL